MKKIVSILLSAMILISLSGCEIFSEEIVDDEAGFCYSQLNNSQKKVYIAIRDGILEYATEISSGLGNFKHNDFDRIYNAVLADHPEFFWVSDSYTYYSNGVSDDVSKIEPDYTMTDSEIETNKEKFDKLVQSLVAQTLSYTNKYDIVVAIHDYIVKHTDYNDDGDKLNSTAYGALIKNKAICSGYSKAFQYLLQQSGIKCCYVTGEIANNEGHAWNIVTIDGDSFFVDVTFDDPVFAGGNNTGETVFHNYFGLTDSQLQSTHSIYDTFDYPKCTTEDYDYYKYKGLYISGANVSLAESIISSAYQSGKSAAVMKFSDISSLNSIKDSIFNGKKIFEIIKSKNSINYSIDETNCVLIVKIR